MQKYYAAIDLKSFYSSVECVEMGLDPLTTNLVVADSSRTEKTICLAVSPSLKSYGLPGRARLFEVIEKIKNINFDRKKSAPFHKFTGKSYDAAELAKHPEYELDFIIAKPRMQKYLDYSRDIYKIYLQHIAPTDIFAYSIDEIFCDISDYLSLNNYTPEDFVSKIVQDVFQQTGITATAGIGTNLFLAKVAMDVIAKHTEPNSAGVRIGSLNEKSFREQLWSHQPITDFWRIGPGTAKRLHERQMFTLGDVALCSINNEDLLYKLLGINAEILIDHAWGIEPVTIPDIKNHKPRTKCLNNGQVLSRPYTISEARTVIKEMSESLTLELTRKKLFTNQLVLHIEYDKTTQPANHSDYKLDRYGNSVPKPAHGTWRLDNFTAKHSEITFGFLELFDQITNPDFLVRRIYLTTGNLQPESSPKLKFQQTNFFSSTFSKTNHDSNSTNPLSQKSLASEQNLQHAILKIRERFGPNAILRGTNFDPGATGKERHRQIGGHAA